MSPLWALAAVAVVLIFAVWMEKMGLEILELDPMFFLCVGIFFALFIGASVLVGIAAPRMDAPSDVATLGSEQTGYAFSQFFAARWFH